MAMVGSIGLSPSAHNPGNRPWMLVIVVVGICLDSDADMTNLYHLICLHLRSSFLRIPCILEARAFAHRQKCT